MICRPDFLKYNALGTIYPYFNIKSCECYCLKEYTAHIHVCFSPRMKMTLFTFKPYIIARFTFSLNKNSSKSSSYQRIRVFFNISLKKMDDNSNIFYI